MNNNKNDKNNKNINARRGRIIILVVIILNIIANKFPLIIGIIIFIGIELIFNKIIEGGYRINSISDFFETDFLSVMLLESFKSMLCIIIPTLLIVAIADYFCIMDIVLWPSKG